MLRQQPVYYANAGFYFSFLPFSGFIVSRQQFPLNPRDYPQVYGFAIDITKTSFHVSPALFKHAINDSKLSGYTKLTLMALKGEKFLTVEDFQRHFFIIYSTLSETPRSPLQFDLQIHFPADEMRYLISLNQRYNDIKGAYIPIKIPTHCAALKAHWHALGKTYIQQLPLREIHLLEVLMEQQIYFQYIDEKLGIGKTLSAEAKDLLALNNEQRLLLTQTWVHHKKRPATPYEANCQSATTSLIERAMNKAQACANTQYRAIVAPTLFAIGKNHRMHLHDPLLINECIDALRHYIQQRACYGNNFWGTLFKLTKEHKINAATKMLSLLRQVAPVEALTSAEIKALQQGRLGAIARKYPQIQAKMKLLSQTSSSADKDPLPYPHTLPRLRQ